MRNLRHVESTLFEFEPYTLYSQQFSIIVVFSSPFPNLNDNCCMNESIIPSYTSRVAVVNLL